MSTSNVLHVIPSVAARYGGPSTAIVAMCDSLNGLPGVTAEVLATDADGPNRFDLARWPSSRTKLHLVPRGDRGQVRAWLDANIPRFDIVHTHSSWNGVVYAARRAAVRHRKPLVYRPCGMLSGYSWSRRKLLRYGYWFARERGNVRAAAAFHCTSEGEAAEVRAHRAARGEIHVIPNGVDDIAWTQPVDPDTLHQRCGPNASGRPLVLFLSRLHPKKGLTDLLLPALVRAEDAFLAVVGGPDDHAPGYEAEVLATVARLGLQQRVALLGPVPSAERWAMFDGADVFALPSRSENFGIVVAEAMARGCPVLVTNGVQSHEHVTRAGAGMVVEPTVVAVADGLGQVLCRARETITACGREYARQHFDWREIASRLADLYHRLTGRPDTKLKGESSYVVPY